ncbi:MAG: NUDIX hydrolase [Hyphomicrobiales bacterium]
MSGSGIISLERIDAVFEQRDWAFATERSSEIAAHWARLAGANRAFFNGRVLLQYQRRIEAGVFHARYLETDYSAFLTWRDFGWPDKTVCNGFAMAALRSGDGAFLLGEMGAHTANPGKVYFAAGTPDPEDVTADGRVDLLGSLMRELEEETGLSAAEVSIGDGWTAILEAQRIAFMRPVAIDMEAEAARRLILSRLAAQAEPELADIRIVRSTADIDKASMPGFTCAFLEHALARGRGASSE